MDVKVEKLKTPEECAIFEKNVLERGRPDLAIESRKRALELRAQKYGAKTELEMECLKAIYAYEQVLTIKNGKTTRASRTWQMIDRHGILEGVERAVKRKAETIGFTALLEVGLEDYAFEYVIVRNPESFSAEALQRSQERVNEWKSS